MPKGSGKVTIDPAFGLQVIHYEVKMLYASAELLARTAPGTAEYNAYLESFVMHGRNLYEIFFFKGPGDEDYVHASQFLDGAETAWEPNASLRSELGPLLWTKASVMLAHPTYQRKDFMPPEQKAWDYGDIASKVSGEVDRFVSLVAAGPFSENEWFGRLAALELTPASPPAQSAKPLAPRPMPAHSESEPSVHTATGSTASEFMTGVIETPFGSGDESK